MNSKKYLVYFVSWVCLCVLLVAGFNIAVDPYAIFGTPRWAGVNEYKADISPYVYLSKPISALRQHPEVLIVGNSRVEMGLNPAHPCFAGQSVQNLGIPGAPVGKQLALALNSLYQSPVKRVFLSLDFVDFLHLSTASEPEIQMAYEDLPLQLDGAENSAYRWYLWQTQLKGALSLASLVSSVKTVAQQQPYASTRTLHGFNPVGDFKGIVKTEGVAALFIQKNASLQAKYQQAFVLPTPQHSLEMVQLKQFLQVAEQRHIQVYAFTNPFHQQFWQVMQQSGLLVDYPLWLQQIQSLLQQHANVSFWDFSVRNDYTMEDPYATPNSRKALHWFWEPAHYTQALGDLMLNSMLADQCDEGAVFIGARQLF